MSKHERPAPPMDFGEAMEKSFHRPFRVSGFTFVRNGVKFGYPFRESILSLLPIVDEIIVNVGESSDDTLRVVEELAEEFSKIKVLRNKWDDSLRKGAVLAEQTNIALDACTGKWGIYLQADEVLHEDDYMWILDALKRADRHEDVDGLLFDYLHFYGDYRVVNWNPSAYRHEIRGVRLGRNVRSYGDAQGFRFADNQKLNVARANARIFHYGWVRPPEVMKAKTEAMDRLYHGEGKGTGDNYKYRRIYGLEKYKGSHPLVMMDRVRLNDWSEELLTQPLYFHWKDIRKVGTRWVEKLFGKRPFEYRNYILREK